MSQGIAESLVSDILLTGSLASEMGDVDEGAGLADEEPEPEPEPEEEEEEQVDRLQSVVDDGDPLLWRRRTAVLAAKRRAKADAARGRAERRLRRRAAAEAGAVDDSSSEDLSLSPDDEPAGGGQPPSPSDTDSGSDSDSDEVVLPGGATTHNRPLQVAASVWDSLFGYQQTCLKWLWAIHQQRHGGIVGDEMGLGKTVQIASFLGALQRSGMMLRPALVVAPVTVLKQWIREFHKWAPKLRAVVLHASGSSRDTPARLLSTLPPTASVVVTSYHAVRRHLDLLKANHFQYVVLDEGHYIRNHLSKVTIAVKQLLTVHRLLLTGSPVQNRLTELWSLFDFVYPGKLGSMSMFQKKFETPINTGGFKGASREQIENAYRCCRKLRMLTAPYMLRRMKKDVGTQLPQKTEDVLFCRLSPVQVRMYVNHLKATETKECIKESGRTSLNEPVTSVAALHVIMTLRKICNHPLLVADKEDLDPVSCSSKMKVTAQVLRQWRAEGHKVLLFSQSKGMLDLLAEFLRAQNWSFKRMDGRTKVADRLPLIDSFNRDNTFVFLLTPKVGGLGVNLTGADRVLIFDPDWNPTTDLQARERAWRIGQKKDVVIYRLVTVGTIEEKIFQRQVFKGYLTDRVLKDPTQRRFFCARELRDLFTLSADYREVYLGTCSLRQRAAAVGRAPERTGVLMNPSPPRSVKEEEAELPAPADDESYMDESEESEDPVVRREQINTTPWGFEPGSAPPTPEPETAAEQHKRTLRGLLNGEQVRFAAGFEVSMQVHSGGSIHAEAAKIEEAERRRSRRSDETPNRPTREPSGLRRRSSSGVFRKRALDDGEDKLLNADEALPAKRRAKGEALSVPPLAPSQQSVQPPPRRMSQSKRPRCESDDDAPPCRGWSDLTTRFRGRRAAVRTGQHGTPPGPSRTGSLDDPNYDLYTRRLGYRTGTFRPRGVGEGSESGSDEAPRMLVSEPAPLSLPEPAPPAPAPKTLPLREQLRAFIQSSPGSKCSTPAIVAMFQHQIGDKAGQVTRDSFRTALTEIARFDPAAAVWEPQQ